MESEADGVCSGEYEEAADHDGEEVPQDQGTEAGDARDSHSNQRDDTLLASDAVLFFVRGVRMFMGRDVAEGQSSGVFG